MGVQAGGAVGVGAGGGGGGRTPSLPSGTFLLSLPLVQQTVLHVRAQMSGAGPAVVHSPEPCSVSPPETMALRLPDGGPLDTQVMAGR